MSIGSFILVHTEILRSNRLRTDERYLYTHFGHREHITTYVYVRFWYNGPGPSSAPMSGDGLASLPMEC